MSDLQIGLVLAGVVIIVSVVLYNWWQDKRIRQQMQAHLPDTEADPLMGDSWAQEHRKEPTVRIAHSLREGVEESATPADEVDATCEAVIDLHFVEPISGEALTEVLRTYLRSLSKPLRFFATTNDGAYHNTVHKNAHYSSMQLAVLVANRQGPLSDIEWSRLWSAAQSIAQHFDATIEGPEQDQVLQWAAQLDSHCASLDAHVGIVVELPGPTSFTRVMDAVRDAGFLEYGKQTAWLADSGVPRFTVMFDGLLADDVKSASVSRLELLLDVPNSPSDGEAFSRMASVARNLAATFQGELVDDGGRPLSSNNDEQLDQQILELYQQLEDAGFIPGSPRTARVFA